MSYRPMIHRRTDGVFRARLADYTERLHAAESAERKAKVVSSPKKKPASKKQAKPA